MRFFFVLALLALFQAHDAFAAGGKEIALPRRDGKETPVRLYGDWSQCLPTIILSHGMGGDDSELAYIGNAAAANGYRAIVMGHTETGRKALRSIIFTRKNQRNQALLNPIYWQGRFDDIDATIKYAKQNCRVPMLVFAGHSMGAATLMLEAGARGQVNYGGRDRFDAYIALSPQGVSWMFKNATAWSAIKKPVLLITGTEDSDYQNRAKVFDYLPNGYKRLVVIESADHMDLGGRGGKEIQSTAIQAIFDYLGMLKNNSLNAVQYTNAVVKDK